ncbi:Sau3AI family type II restriction endonuclease [uncultured Ezakiella sp.]|uniref:Sau3AI family type II restriction endonuclease n=1 Tax=uncultured Ezakiella sp. TaxID=1637529 RepID=UPI0025FBB353|nr:Sau3AI family type II restriction endonuclease [uncultured Ezakiella sp.]
MEKHYDYDENDPNSIETYTKQLIGKTFRDIISARVAREEALEYNYIDNINVKNKGNLGQLVEENFFGYERNNDPRPDFHEAGVELKVTPYKINKNGSISAKERLILTMIDYFSVIDETFEDSHLWQKANLILLIYYLFDANKESNLDYRIDYVKLFTPPENDIKIIKHDFELIVDKILRGKAHELSESDTLYLGAASKASTSKDRRKQPKSDILAKPRAFSYKNSYMTYVLNNYILPGNRDEQILKTETDIPFEEYVNRKIAEYKDKSIDELCDIFDLNKKNKPKHIEAMLAYRILGIKGNKAEEFEKANVKVKAIRVTKNNKIRESMSFPNFDFKELAEEDWEDSRFANELRETRFLFVVYKEDEEGNLRLKGSQFWNIPYDDLENEVKSVWQRTKDRVNEGVKFEIRGNRVLNNLPKAKDNPVCHVRPHAAKAAYKLRDYKSGNIELYANELPDGQWMTKQCFWLNNTYILSQLNKSLLN